MPTNTRKLKARLVECGLSTAQAANTIGISRQSLCAKINNKSDFRASEIRDICALLHIDDVEEYFFCGENSQIG